MREKILSQSGQRDPLTDRGVSCLFSHKCESRFHDYGVQISPVFKANSVKLLIDPFGPGENITARIQALEFQALLFLLSPESWDSPYCQAELAAAQSASVPIFMIRWSGVVPDSFRDRIFLDCEGGTDVTMTNSLHRLARAISIRASIRALIQELCFPNTPETVRSAAQRLADEPDCTALTEFLDCIERTYTSDMDPIARGDLALAVGKTRTDKAERILMGWQSSDDLDLPQKLILQALKWVRNKPSHNDRGEES